MVRLLAQAPLPLWRLLQVITTGALVMELAAVGVLGATFVTYDYYSSKDDYSYY
jgi:hypothetical protein